MTDMDRARELIEKYLNDVIDKVELAELAKGLDAILPTNPLPTLPLVKP